MLASKLTVSWTKLRTAAQRILLNTDQLWREVSQTWFFSDVLHRRGWEKQQPSRRTETEREGRRVDGWLFSVAATFKPVRTAGRSKPDLLWVPIGYNCSRPACQGFDWLVIGVGGSVDWHKGREVKNELKQIERTYMLEQVQTSITHLLLDCNAVLCWEIKPGSFLRILGKILKLWRRWLPNKF